MTPRTSTTGPATGTGEPVDTDTDEAPATGRLQRWRRRLPDAVTCAVVVAMIGFVLGGLGLELSGLRVLADTSSLTTSSIYRDGGMPQTASGTLGLNDTIDSATPSEALFGAELRRGNFAAWNPYALGGAPLGATPNYGLLSPLAAPFWILPGWLAPAYVKLLEVVVAIGGTYLFLRRLRLRPAAAWLGGLIYSSSAFLVVWTGWPQTRTAAVIPALFWALERLADRLRWREVALVALAVAGLLLGGFPSITGYALLTGAFYLAVRLLARRPLQWRVILARGAAAGGAVLAGAAVTAWQLIPWAQFMTTALVRGRDQVPGTHIRVEDLLTVIAPNALGSANARSGPTWFAGSSLIEGESYVGAAALVLVVVAVALAGRGRSLLPRGVWWFLVAATLSWGAVIYLGGAPLALLQQTGYLFSENFVGRARSVLGLLVAALAAVGFELVLRRRDERAAVSPASPSPALPSPALPSPALPSPRGARWYGIGVWVVVGVTGLFLYILGRRLAVATGTTIARTGGSADSAITNVANLNRQLDIGLALAVAAAGALAWLWFGRPAPRHGAAVSVRRRRLATAALVLIPVLVAGQAFAWVITYYPHSKKVNFYPTNDVHAYLADNLGHERFFGAAGAIYGSVETIHGLREFHGHGFMEQGYGDLVAALPGQQFANPPTPATVIRGTAANGATARSPILDRAAVSEYIAPKEILPFGDLHTATGDGSAASLSVGHPITVTVPVTGPVRGVGITPAGKVFQTLHEKIVVTLRDSAGAVVAQALRVDRGITGGSPFVIPLAADTVSVGTTLTATFELEPFTLAEGEPVAPPPPLALAARGGQPAVSVVTPTPADGLQLVFDDQTVIYQRVNALPRARWASSTVVEPDAAARVALLASGKLPDDQVVLNSPGAAADGKPATVDWIDDGTDSMTLRVSAQGAGYLVLADAIQHGWTATMDGSPAPIVPADHAFAGVAVPAGPHEIRFTYHPVTAVAATVSITALLGLLVPVGIELFRERRRRRSTA